MGTGEQTYKLQRKEVDRAVTRHFTDKGLSNEMAEQVVDKILHSRFFLLGLVEIALAEQSPTTLRIMAALAKETEGSDPPDSAV